MVVLISGLTRAIQSVFGGETGGKRRDPADPRVFFFVA